LRSIKVALATGDRGEIGDRLRDIAARAVRQPHVEADADDRSRRPERIAVQLDQDSAELQMPMDQVVRPLERDTGEALGLERPRHGNADGQREAREESGALLEAPAEREHQAAADDRGPRAPAPAASRGLPFRRQRDAVNVAARDAAHQLVRRRIDLVDHFDRHRRQRSALGVELGEKRLDRLRVEEIRRFEQAIAAPLDALHREAGGLGFLEHLRDARARQPHLGGEILTRVEVTIGETAQQRETKRSEH
jgi:hypothetical protein